MKSTIFLCMFAALLIAPSTTFACGPYTPDPPRPAVVRVSKPAPTWRQIIGRLLAIAAAPRFTGERLITVREVF